jgi:TRAP-type C4-dicarboxylate transport system permease small subunit
MRSFFRFFDRVEPFYDIMDKAILVICKVLLIVVVAITAMAVAGRYVSFIPDPAWSEEIVLTCMSYMAVLSAALAIRRKSHIRMTGFDRYLPRKVLLALDVFANGAVTFLGFIMIFVGWQYAQRLGARGTYVSIPALSRIWMYLPVPVAGVAMVIFELEALYSNLKELVLGESPQQ